MEQTIVEEEAILFARTKMWNMEDSIADSFKSGVRWRINSVWHGVDEQPEDGRMVLGVDEDGSPAICGPDNEGWDDTAKSFCINAWAYVSDLLPDTFDGILEEGKDVLKRLKEKGD